MIKFNPKKPRVTQQEIARLAGVSHVAVSHTLHRPLQARISLEKQEEIRRIAQELGYQPRKITTHTIALALPTSTLSLDITSSTIRFANEVLRERGYRLTLAAFDDNDPSLGGFILDQKSADGVLLTAPPELFGNAISPDLPSVLMSDADETKLPDIDQVALDAHGTIDNIVAYLADRGHERIGLIVSIHYLGQSIFDNHLRQGFLKSMKAHGRPDRNCSLIEIGTSGKIAGPVLTRLKQKEPPTALIAGSAARAMLLVNSLQWGGYRVPEDVSVVSLNDSGRLQLMNPEVTATTAAGMEVISLAIERLLEKMEDPTLPPRRDLIAGTMIERESVKSLL